MVHLTEQAVIKLKEIAKEQDLALSIRLKVIGGGCAGFTNDLFFDEPSELDEVVEQDEIKIVIDPISFQYLEDTTLDYISSSFGEGFKFISPKAKGSCGCGSSVSY